jgi:hypothetical protein
MLIRLISINPVSDGRLGPVDTKKSLWAISSHLGFEEMAA